MSGATVSGLFEQGWIAALSGNRLYKIRAGRVVLATGQFDQPAVFRNNDLPGVMFASAAQRLMSLYAARPGKRAVVLAANNMGYGAALDPPRRRRGSRAIVDLRPSAHGALAAAVRSRGVRVLDGAIIAEAHGGNRVEAVTVADFSGRAAGAVRERIDCDLVLMSAGYMPAGNLGRPARRRAVYDTDNGYAPGVVRTPRGVLGLRRGHSIVPTRRCCRLKGGGPAQSCSRRPRQVRPGERSGLGPDGAQVTHPWPIVEHKQGKDFIDFDEDLQVKDIRNSVKEGYDDIQLVKRYSTMGMGSSQGRHSNVNAIRIVADQTGRDHDTVGTPTFRRRWCLRKFGHMAGRGFEPARFTAMHHRHVELGAEMMVAGLWYRPAHYGGRDNIAEEVRTVREGVGIIDVSDARRPRHPRPGRGRVRRPHVYLGLCRPAGRPRPLRADDRPDRRGDRRRRGLPLPPEPFYLTATTSGVDQVYRQMLWWNANGGLDVDIANVTAAYCGVNVAGPKSRDVLAALETDIDLSAEAFPYMGVRTAGSPASRSGMLRVGFVGELGFEIHAPAEMGEALWDQLMEAGRPFGIRPFGVEAQRVMRLEKAHIIIGQDTDGLTHPGECGMEWALSQKEALLCRQARGRHADRQGNSPQAGRLHADRPGRTLPQGVPPRHRRTTITGRVTSAVVSPTLNG
jgi:sarcosine oxidase subunit alpha